MGKVRTNSAPSNQRATKYCTNPILWEENKLGALINVRIKGVV